MRTREGDLLQIRDGTIFDVKGLVHPCKRTIAFPRFVPDLEGNRKRKGITYRKIYALSERFKLLEERFHQYLVLDPVFDERLCEVPEEDIKQYYNPIDRLQKLRESSQLDKLEADALRFVEFLQSYCRVSWGELGISGSLLAKLHTLQSDIDPVVYGERGGRKIHETLKLVLKEGDREVRAYSLKELRLLYNFRSKDTQMAFADFVKTERRKVLQGKFSHHDFFIRCVKDWSEFKERYGDVTYRKVGYARIRATITDASEAIFTPCRYLAADVELLKGEFGEVITEIASFRGRFCEQAEEGESVVAQGKVEEVRKKNGGTFFRLLLGGNRSDFMALEE